MNAPGICLCRSTNKISVARADDSVADLNKRTKKKTSEAHAADEKGLAQRRLFKLRQD